MMHFFARIVLLMACGFVTTTNLASGKDDPQKDLQIAEVFLLHQRDNGGWPKNYDDTTNLSKKDRQAILSQKDRDDTTFDNGATYSEMKHLAKVYAATGDARYQRAFIKGLDFTLAAQYENGGWPQFYPKTSGYHAHITFNDNAMIGVMQLLKAIASGDQAYPFVDQGRRKRCGKAVAQGVQCILKCQIEVNGKKTAWCAQHDARSFAPQKARSYELRSISGSESVGVVRYLMAIDAPSREVIDAIQGAVAWFDAARLTGIKVERKEDKSAPKGHDKLVVQDPSAPPLWARFYAIGNNKPIFCSRDGVPRERLAEISHERRNGYSWYSDRAARLLSKDYPAWQRKWAPKNNYDQLHEAFVSPDHARWGEVPLWWWEGEPMRRERVTWQLETLAAKGVRSVCPIQRSPGRCDPPSFSPEWWEMFSYAAKECKRLGMTLWAYDQVGYGHYGWLEKAAAKAQDRRTNRLVFLTAEGDPRRPLRLELPKGRLVGARAYPLQDGQASDAESIDLSDQVHQRTLHWTPTVGKWRAAVSVAVPELAFQLSDQAADTFIDMLYGEVERRLGSGAMGTTFAGMFQDEHPPTPRDVFTEQLAERFRRQTGYEIGRAIPALHFDVGPLTPKYRIDYLDTYLALDEACYWKRVYDWTVDRDILISHDNWGRNDIARQSQGYIDYFRTQRWFSAPGYDDAGTHPVEGRNYYDTKIAASIARLYDRPRVWSEAFHSSGWGRTTDQTLSWLSTNYAFGANLYDEHGLYYSTRASTWEHAAPDPHWRQPYWRYYNRLSDWVARMSYLMSQGSHVVDVAVHYPVVDVLAGSPPGDDRASDPNRYMKLSRAIYNAGMDNDIIDDDSILAAEIEDGRLVVAGNGYQALVFGPERTIRLSVLKKALAFAEDGGTVVFVGGYPSATAEHGRSDAETVRCAEKLFGRDAPAGVPQRAVSRAHAGGGFSGLLPLDPKALLRVLNTHVDRDFAADGGTFYVAHRHIGDVDVYLVQSVADEPVELTATFRVDGVPQRWDPATGDVLAVDSFERNGPATRISQRFEGNTAQLFVFRPGAQKKATQAGGLDRRFEREQRLDGNWQFSVIPTRDNRWGEFRWPPSNETIGPEIRSFRYAEETSTPGVELGWQQAEFDDSAWQTARYSIGPYWLFLNQVPAAVDAAAEVLATTGSAQQGGAITIAGKELAWRGVEFSKTIGLARPMPWGGHSGYPDGAIDRNFIELPEGRKFLFTRIRSPKKQRLGLRVMLRNSKARLWVDGVEQPFEDAVGNLPLLNGANDVLLELPDGGRGMLYVQSQPPSVASMEEAARGRVSPDLADAKWIRDRSAGTGYVRKTFSLDQTPREARLVVTAYTGYRLVINGTMVEEEIGPWAKWTHPESFNVAPLLREGENVIAAWNQVHAGQNVHGSAEMKGFALALEARDEDGRTWRLASDGSWKGTATEQTGWERAGFDDAAWQPVEVLGPIGIEPWGSDFLKNVGVVSEPRRPLAIDLPSPYLTCFDEVPEVAYDIKPASARRVGWYRFVAPPGLRQLELNSTARAQVWVDGQRVEVRAGRADVADPPDGMSTVAVRLEMEPGEYAGAAFPVPIGVVLGGGTIQPGLWSEFGLPTYSGIGVYRQEVEIAAVPSGQRVVLDLGQVLVAAEVLVNGRSVGVRLARPFQFDLTDRITLGDNTIEVRVANTIAPHYTVTNQVNNLGPTDSGLLGPVVLRFSRSALEPKLEAN